MIAPASSSLQQRGAALIAALFLVVVLAALGAFAVNIGMGQQQTSDLQLLQYRTLAAANAGLEFWATQAANNPGLAAVTGCGAVPTLTPPGMNGFTVNISCTSIASGAQHVYEVTATATTGTYGSPDFVRRTVRRRMTDIAAPGTWQ